MKAAELRKQSVGELNETLTSLRREAFKMQLVKASGEAIMTHRVREIRRTVARIETLLRQKQKESKHDK